MKIRARVRKHDIGETVVIGSPLTRMMMVWLPMNSGRLKFKRGWSYYQTITLGTIERLR